MILVTGSVTAREDSFDEILRLSQEHVNRSRAEPGCIAHAVHVDCENPLRLVFFERWADRDALLKHFALPASRELCDPCKRSPQAQQRLNFLTRARSKNFRTHARAAAERPTNKRKNTHVL
jgi:quinol monooxygenase YgiN